MLFNFKKSLDLDLKNYGLPYWAQITVLVYWIWTQKILEYLAGYDAEMLQKEVLCDIKIYFYSIKINLHSLKFIYMKSKYIFVRSK